MPYGIDTSDISIASVPTWVWLLLLIVGLLLCFFGEIIWEFMISILGAIIGSMIGFAIGYAIGGYLCGFGLMFIFAIIGSMLFQYLAKAAVALVCALLAFGAAAYLTYTANPDDLNTPIIVGLVVGVIVFIIAIFFVEEIVSVFLAAIGGFLIGVAVYFIVGGDFALAYAVLAGGIMFGLGAAFQLMYQRQRKRPTRAPPRRRPVRETRPATTTAPKQTPKQPPSQGPKPPTSNV
ncbi:MAG: hypothetical protein JSW00_01915 [Thermoplasmata archaeon]|nr:MAG: hypothetical protein JSW00_01915 [Thermoplasmata archaeon]